MPYRTWVLIFALGLAFSATLLEAQEEAQSGDGGTGEQQYPTQQLPAPLPVQIIEDDESTASRERSEAEARQREIDDLEAQQGMNAATQEINEATQSMKRAAWVSTGIVGIGTALLVWTLILTRDTAKSARNAVTVTQEIGLQQLRPWVLPDFPRLLITTNTKVDGRAIPEVQCVSVAWKNSGQSPAIRSNAFIGIAIVPTGEGYTDNFFTAKKGENTIPPGAQIWTNTTIVPVAFFSAFQANEVDLIVFSRVDYDHALNAKAQSFAEITYRIRRDGVEIDRNTNQERPRYNILIEGSRISEA